LERPWWWNYIETHFRVAEFFIGVITGFLMFREEQNGRKIAKFFNRNKILLFACWSLSIGFFWFYMIKIHTANLSQFTMQVLKAAERELWALAVCWIIFGCHSLKSGGVIRRFLSHRAWQPLSKLSLNMYLLHMYFIYSTNGFFGVKFSLLWMFHVHVGDIFFAILLGALAYVFIEAPAGKLVDFMWKLKEKSTNLKIERRKTEKIEKMPLMVHNYLKSNKV
jgi:peptidoglycan/LPS O-acetylase OafA/YrhL